MSLKWSTSSLQFHQKSLLIFFNLLSILFSGITLEAEWISDITSKEIYPHKRSEIDPFISKEGNIKTIYDFFDQNFYQIDANFFKNNPSNPLKLSTEFMEAYLSATYRRRKDACIKPIKQKEVDALLFGLGTGAMKTRLLALKKSIELGWQFRKIHIITRSEKEQVIYDKLIEELFPKPSQLPPINYTFTYQATNICERGCEILKRRQKISQYYIIIESSDLFTSKVEARCRKRLGLTSTCLGSNTFPHKNWQEEAKIHGYDKLWNKEQMICQWFYSHLQFLARKLHYEFIHGLDIDEEELFAISLLKKDKFTSIPIQQLIEIQLERALAEPQNNYFFITDLLRSFGLIHYLKKLPFSSDTNGLLTKIVLALHQKSPHSGDFEKLFTKSHLYRQRLDKLRKTTAKKLANPSCDITALILEINQERDKILQEMIHHSITLVGPPPSEFSLLVYGSSGRNEATPYSDVEFGILYAADTVVATQYFQALSACIMFQIINLSETILYMLNLPSFHTQHNPEKKEQWFIDEVIPRGFSIDIIDEQHASKLPIATGRGVPFFGTPKTMAKHYLSRVKKENFGYTNLSERVVYGSKRLFQEYQQNKRRLLDKKQKIQTFNEVMKNYSNTIHRPWDSKIDFKNTFYRPPTLALECLADFYSLTSISSLNRIKELYHNQVITKQQATLLTHYLLTVQKTRLTLVLKRCAQYEGVDNNELPEINVLFSEKKETAEIFNQLNIGSPKHVMLFFDYSHK